MTRFCNTPWRGVLLVLVGAIPGGFPGTVAGEERALVVHPVNHLPVGDLANTIAALLEDMRDDESLGDVRLATEVIGNRLVVRGAPEAVQRVTALVTQLDQRPQTVLVEVTVAAVACKEAPGRIPIQTDGSTTADQILQALAQQGDVRVVARAQLSTINNQPAYVQLAAASRRSGA